MIASTMEDFKRRRSHFAPCKRVRQSAVGQSNRRRNPPKRLQSLPVSAQENLHLAFKAPSKRTQTNRCVTELPPSKHKPQPKALHEEQTPIEAHSAQEFLEVFDPLNPLAMVEAARWQRAHPDQPRLHQKVEVEEVERIVPLVYMSEEDRAAEERMLLRKQTQAVLQDVKHQADLRRQEILKDPRRVTAMKSNRSKEMERRLVRQSTHANALLQQIDSSRLRRSIRRVKSDASLRSSGYVGSDDLKRLLGFTGCDLRLDEIDRIVVEHASHPFSPVRWEDIHKIVLNNAATDHDSKPHRTNGTAATDYLFEPRTAVRQFIEPPRFELFPRRCVEVATRFGHSNDRYKSTSYLTQLPQHTPGYSTERQRFGDSRQAQVQADKERKRAIDAARLANTRAYSSHLEVYASQCNRKAWRGEHDRVESIRRQAARYHAVFALQAKRDIARANKRKGKRLFEGIRR